MADDDRLAAAARGLPAPVEIALSGVGDDEPSRALRAFAHALHAAAPERIRLRETDPPAFLPGRPGLGLAASGRGNLHWVGAPEGRELPPFLTALQLVAAAGDPPRAATAAPEGSPAAPAELIVIVSPDCPNCPAVAETVVRLAAARPEVSACVADLRLVGPLVENHGIRSVPATIVDGRLVLVGAVGAERLAGLLAARGTERFAREELRSLLDRRRLADAAALLRDAAARAAILALFAEPDLSTRMGVLVALDEARAREPAAVVALVPGLLGLLAHGDARVRGDIADLLGRVGDPRAIGPLERLAADPDPDVVEAAADALESLRVAPVRGEGGAT